MEPEGRSQVGDGIRAHKREVLPLSDPRIIYHFLLQISISFSSPRSKFFVNCIDFHGKGIYDLWTTILSLVALGREECRRLLQPFPRARLQVWFVRVCSCVLVWTCLAQLVAVGDLWRGHSRLPAAVRFFLSLGNDAAVSSLSVRRQFNDLVPASPPYVPLST